MKRFLGGLVAVLLTMTVPAAPVANAAVTSTESNHFMSAGSESNHFMENPK